MNTLDYVVHNSIFSRIHKIPKISRIPQYLNDKVLSVYQYLPVVFPLAISSSSARPFSECPRWPSVLRKGSSRPCHWPHIFSQCILMVWDNLKSAWIGLVHTWNLVATHIPCSLCVCANKKGRKQLKLGGLYTPPPFPGGLRSDSDGLDLSRMPIFWLWSCWNFPVTFRWFSGAGLPDWWVRRTFQWTVHRTFTKPADKFHSKWPDSSGKSDGSPADSNGHQADSLPY